MKSFFWVITLLLLLAGCGREEADKSADQPYGVQRSAFSRVSVSAIPSKNEANLTAGNSRFAFNLYAALRSQEGNLLISPYSVSSAFAMLYAGAEGETKTQLRETFGFMQNDLDHHAAFNYLDKQLERSAPELTLKTANAVWLQKGFRAKEGFLDTLAAHYGADVKTVAFDTNPTAAAEAINGWVSEQTNGYVDRAVSAREVEDTKLALTNTLFFKARWEKEFFPSNTAQESFTLADGSAVWVPTMKGAGLLAYRKQTDLAAVRLDYAESNQSMLLILPDEGRFEAVESNLSGDLITQIQAGWDTYDVTLWLPKFDYESDFDLADSLKTLGMTDAFVPAANFSALSDERLLIGSVKHKTRIAVDEEGTVGAAATVILMDPTASPFEPVIPTATMKIDRPFFYLIVDQSGAILFIGRVVNPL